MLICKTGLLLQMCHSHSHDVIPIPTPIPTSSLKAIPIHMDSHGNPIPMHTSILDRSALLYHLLDARHCDVFCRVCSDTEQRR